MKARWFTTILLAFTLLWTSCDPGSHSPTSADLAKNSSSISEAASDGGPAEKITTRLLGRRHGIILPLLGGTISLLQSVFVAPPGAVTLPTVVTWEIFADRPTDLPFALNRVYNFYPHLLHFLIPTTVSISFVDAGLGTNDPNEYTFYYFNELSGEWEPQPTSVDIENQRFIVTLHHFSRYAFAR